MSEADFASRRYPTATFVLYVLAILAMVLGVPEIIAAIQDRLGTH